MKQPSLSSIAAGEAAWKKHSLRCISPTPPCADLLKAAAIHFYIAYLHPYFDGNGRMARLVHLWYLRRQGYSYALFIPFSSYIERSRNEYYKAYSLAEHQKTALA